MHESLRQSHRYLFEMTNDTSTHIFVFVDNLIKSKLIAIKTINSDNLDYGINTPILIGAAKKQISYEE